MKGGASNARQDFESSHPRVGPVLFHLTSVAKALREIKYYQQRVVEGSFIPPRAFQKLVKQISDEASTGGEPLRWESDAIFALQSVTEDVLTMIFEMTYFLPSLCRVLKVRNRLAIHAKRQTVMDRDMKLLRDLWKRINPDCAIGADDRATMEIKKRNQEAEKARIHEAQKTAKERVAKARANGTIHKLPLGLRIFCRQYGLITSQEFSLR
jgi:histone H3/H4